MKIIQNEIKNELSPNNSNQSTFTFSKSNSLIESSNAKIQNNVNIYDIDSCENKNYFTPPYSNDIEPDFYPQCTFNCDLMNIERDVKPDDGLYGGSFIWNFEDYFSI